MSGTAAVLESPIESYKKFVSSTGSLRTGYTHRFGGFQPGVDRSAAEAFRLKCRTQEHTGQTSGFAPGFIQANFVMLPKDAAFEFLTFALRNPKACPLLAYTDPGDPCPRNVAPTANVCTDIPKYRVWRNGELAEEVADVTHLWDDSMVGFLLGCSFSWEDKLRESGCTPRQIEEHKNVPMYRTNIPNEPCGKFSGELVVSMRPYLPEQIAKVAEITGSYPGAHGGPVHWGDPAAIGLTDAGLGTPDWGDGVTIRPGEVPVFWACGVTPQTAIMSAKLPLAVTHAPGHMFVCDLTDDELFVATAPAESFGR